ncbi:MAG TPA: carboxylesterase family protein, partial [Xanthomonadales bacterium]|nr:carboxylesterase family protein [Xanthomonadales bacterium]
MGFNGYRGLWYDRAHPGHGVDVQQVGATYLVVFYTFGADGEPEWLAAQGPITSDVFEQDLLRFGYDHATRTARVTSTVGRLAMRWNATTDAPACAGASRTGAGELVVLEARIGAERVDWCLEPLLHAQVLPESGMSGSWWGGPDDSGWGLATYFVPQPPAATHSIHVLYHYDAAGSPRWVYAEADDTDFELATRWQSYRGYCRACAPVALVARDAGPLALALSTPRRGAGLGNRIDESATYPGAAGGAWTRRGELHRFSDTLLYGGTVATREGLIAPDIFLDDGNHDLYVGIPYAAPPTGANRLRAPQPAPARTRVLEVIERTPGCPQNPAVGVFGGAPATTSEDCLTLNVWVPAHPRRRPLPVMVWIHGGGFIQGGALQEAPTAPLLVYEGAPLSTRDVIVVTVNYRLGPFGFLAVRELIGEHADHPSTGNYGFLDQVAALAWVRDNIAEFGGDPGNVTIFGESAGGVSVCGHVASPLSRGLFHRAIMQSGNCL